MPQEPLILPDNCDYYIITDSNIDESSKWKKIDINNIQFEEDGLTNPMKNRYVKMHPDKLFPDYDYSLYIDGSIRICTDVTEYINRISNYGVSFYDHNLRDCVYDEIMACIALEKADKNELLQHKDYLISSGMPEKYGLVACGIIARQHNNEMCKKLMNEWWYEYSYHVKRDQLCLPLVLYKNKVLPVDIALLGNNMYNDDSFEFYKHTV